MVQNFLFEMSLVNLFMFSNTKVMYVTLIDLAQHRRLKAEGSMEFFTLHISCTQ